MTLAFALLFASVVLARGVEHIAGAKLLTGNLPAEWLRSSLHASLFAVLLVATARPLTALALLVAALGALQIASSAKKALLDEAIVFSDLALARQALRHPQLYYVSPREYPLPWLGLIVFAAGLSLSLSLEPPIPRAVLLLPAALVAISLLGAAAACSASLYRSPALLLPPDMGARDFGLVTALFLQWRGWRAQSAAPRPEGKRPSVAECDVILVQMESFADLPARGYPMHPLPRWEALKAGAVGHGPLAVEALGANTIRTEFAVLTGLTGSDLGFDRFNPYLRPQPYAAAAWPERFRKSGWITTCIHPNDGGFFGREKVMPALGFDTFWAIERFAGASRFGPHVSDEAVMDAVLNCLDQDARPQFIFAITMENHGPWNAPRINAASDPEQAYMRHLQNAEGAIARLVAAVSRRRRRAVIVAYGDHLPALPSIRCCIAGTDTSYLIIDTAAEAAMPIASRRIAAHRLLEAALEAAARPARRSG